MRTSALSTFTLYILLAALTHTLIPQITFFGMSYIMFPCPEEGCGKSFRKSAYLSRHIWSHIPTKFRPRCPGTRKGVNGVDVPCAYRYRGRRDLWKSHWEYRHQHNTYPSNYRFDNLRVCRKKYGNRPSAPLPVADITSSIDIGTSSAPALTLIGNESHPLPALRTPVSDGIQTQEPLVGLFGPAGIQTQEPFVGLFGPAVADMSTPFHPSINVPYSLGLDFIY